LAEGKTEDLTPDASSDAESNRGKSRLSKMLQRPPGPAPVANEQAHENDKSF
jgi:hypothetical protein